MDVSVRSLPIEKQQKAEVTSRARISLASEIRCIRPLGPPGENGRVSRFAARSVSRATDLQAQMAAKLD